MATGIRQFLTFEEHLSGLELGSPNRKDAYFAALEVLRAHLNRGLHEIETLARMDPVGEGLAIDYAGPWRQDHYETLDLTNAGSVIPDKV